MTPAIILTVLVGLTPYRLDIDEPPDHRRARLAPVAENIAAVAKTDERAAEMIALLAHESRAARYVQEGRCDEGPVGERCDMKHRRPMARGLWQLHKSACPTAYEFPAGSSDSLAEEVKCAANRLDWAWATAAQPTLLGALTTYCRSPVLAAQRVSTYRFVLWRLNAARKAGK